MGKKNVLPFILMIAIIIIYGEKSALSFTVINVNKEYVDPKKHPGPYLRWNLNKPIDGRVLDGKVLYRLNSKGSNDIPDFSQVKLAVIDSINSWQSIATTRFRAEYKSKTDKYLDLNDNLNTIFWDENGVWEFDETAYGQTFISYDDKTGDIDNVDIGLNGYKGVVSGESFIMRWTTEDVQEIDWDRHIITCNVQANITHEFGHLLGLGHSSVNHATMHVPGIGTEQRYLKPDDKAGISFLYPADNYLEDFNDGKAQKWSSSYPSYWRVFLNGTEGVFRAFISSPVPLQYISMVSTYNGGIYEDFRYSVRIKQEKVSMYGYASYIIFRATSDFNHTYGVTPNTKGSGYAFGIDDGQTAYPYKCYLVFKLINGQISIIKGWTKSDYIKPTTQWNTLKVIAKGNLFKLYINNNLVYQFIDSSIANGRIGLLGYTNANSNTKHYYDSVSLYNY